jgi:hypothetical protein
VRCDRDARIPRRAQAGHWFYRRAFRIARQDRSSEAALVLGAALVSSATELTGLCTLAGTDLVTARGSVLLFVAAMLARRDLPDWLMRIKTGPALK